MSTASSRLDWRMMRRQDAWKTNLWNRFLGYYQSVVKNLWKIWFAKTIGTYLLLLSILLRLQHHHRRRRHLDYNYNNQIIKILHNHRRRRRRYHHIHNHRRHSQPQPSTPPTHSQPQPSTPPIQIHSQFRLFRSVVSLPILITCLILVQIHHQVCSFFMVNILKMCTMVHFVDSYHGVHFENVHNGTFRGDLLLLIVVYSITTTTDKTCSI